VTRRDAVEAAAARRAATRPGPAEEEEEAAAGGISDEADDVVVFHAQASSIVGGSGDYSIASPGVADRGMGMLRQPSLVTPVTPTAGGEFPRAASSTVYDWSTTHADRAQLQRAMAEASASIGAPPQPQPQQQQQQKPRTNARSAQHGGSRSSPPVGPLLTHAARRGAPQHLQQQHLQQRQQTQQQQPPSPPSWQGGADPMSLLLQMVSDMRREQADMRREQATMRAQIHALSGTTPNRGAERSPRSESLGEFGDRSVSSSAGRGISVPQADPLLPDDAS